MTPEVRSLILTAASPMEIADAAVRGGMRRMRDDGIEKVRHGRHLGSRGAPRPRHLRR